MAKIFCLCAQTGQTGPKRYGRYACYLLIATPDYVNDCRKYTYTQHKDIFHTNSHENEASAGKCQVPRWASGVHGSGPMK